MRAAAGRISDKVGVHFVQLATNPPRLAAAGHAPWSTRAGMAASTHRCGPLPHCVLDAQTAITRARKTAPRGFVSKTDACHEARVTTPVEPTNVTSSCRAGTLARQVFGRFDQGARVPIKKVFHQCLITTTFSAGASPPVSKILMVRHHGDFYLGAVGLRRVNTLPLLPVRYDGS